MFVCLAIGLLFDIAASTAATLSVVVQVQCRWALLTQGELTLNAATSYADKTEKGTAAGKCSYLLASDWERVDSTFRSYFPGYLSRAKCQLLITQLSPTPSQLHQSSTIQNPCQLLTLSTNPSLLKKMKFIQVTIVSFCLDVCVWMGCGRLSSPSQLDNKNFFSFSSSFCTSSARPGRPQRNGSSRSRRQRWDASGGDDRQGRRSCHWSGR